MSISDFGPVPVSQFKSEARRIFDALAAGRRVLLSRRGHTVAVIDPASVDEDEHALAMFAVGKMNGLRELSATTISQRSPAEFVRAAEDGVSSYVTRDHKVYGVMRPLDRPAGDRRIPESLDLIAAREQALVQFEQDHPNATPEEFAAAVAEWSPSGQLATLSSGHLPQQEDDEVSPRQAPGSRIPDEILETFVDALLLKAEGLEALGKTPDHQRTFIELLDQSTRHFSQRLFLESSPRPDESALLGFRERLYQQLVSRGRFYMASDPGRAVEFAEAAIESIRGADEALAEAEPHAGARRAVDYVRS